GRGFQLQGDGPLLVGGGYGVAPLVFLARRARAGSAIRAAIGAASADDLLLVPELEALGVRVATSTEDGSAGHRGLVTDLVDAWWDEAAPDGLYACGPHGMLEAVERLVAARGVPAQLAWEAYMRCGIGICGSCVHRGRVLCVEGPVLEAPARTRGVGKSDVVTPVGEGK
ncbi:MAG: dihydroorotate dehydrogenase electron transfer subunit, partial [Anaerolineae bacterium]